MNQDASGNISPRIGERMLITPSGIPFEKQQPEDIASMSVADDAYEWDGPNKPSSEWHFHRAIQQSNEDFGAVIHTHSMSALFVARARPSTFF